MLRSLLVPTCLSAMLLASGALADDQNKNPAQNSREETQTTRTVTQ